MTENHELQNQSPKRGAYLHFNDELKQTFTRGPISVFQFVQTAKHDIITEAEVMEKNS